MRSSGAAPWLWLLLLCAVGLCLSLLSCVPAVSAQSDDDSCTTNANGDVLCNNGDGSVWNQSAVVQWIRTEGQLLSDSDDDDAEYAAAPPVYIPGVQQSFVVNGDVTSLSSNLTSQQKNDSMLATYYCKQLVGQDINMLADPSLFFEQYVGCLDNITRWEIKQRYDVVETFSGGNFTVAPSIKSVLGSLRDAAAGGSLFTAKMWDVASQAINDLAGNSDAAELFAFRYGHTYNGTFVMDVCDVGANNLGSPYCTSWMFWFSNPNIIYVKVIWFTANVDKDAEFLKLRLNNVQSSAAWQNGKLRNALANEIRSWRNVLPLLDDE